MNGRDIALLVATVAVVILVALLNEQRQTTPSTYSSYDTGLNGYRALYEVMRREGVTVRRFEDALGTFHARSGTMLVSSNDVERYASEPVESLDSNDAAALATFVRGGGRLVVLGDALQYAGASAVDPPKVAGIVQAPTAGPADDDPLTGGVRSVSGAFVSAFVIGGRRRVRTLLDARGRPVATAFAVGKGTVVAVTTPGIFGNAVLARDQNARFAYDVLAGSGPLLFDEGIHGHTAGGPLGVERMWSVLPESVHAAMWTLLAVLVLAAIGGIFRAAPPVVLEPPRPRDSAAYVASMAALLHRARAGRAAVDRFAQDGLRLAQMRPSVAQHGAIATDLSALEALQQRGHPSDSDVVAAARLNVRLRKELA